MSRLEHCLENAIAAIEQGKDYDAWRDVPLYVSASGRILQNYGQQRKCRNGGNTDKHGEVGIA